MTKANNYAREKTVAQLLSEAGGRVQYMRTRTFRKFADGNPNLVLLPKSESALSRAKYYKNKFERAKAMFQEQAANGFDSEKQKKQMDLDIRTNMAFFLESCYSVGMLYNKWQDAPEDIELVKGNK